MDIDEVKKTLSNYKELKKLACSMLNAGGIHFGGIDSIWLDGDSVVVFYWDVCHGETCHDEEWLPVKMFTDGADLGLEWAKVREEREQRQKKAEAVAKRAAKRAEEARANL